LSDVASDTITRPANTASLSFLGLSALGVVFGDIGTSPLYTLKTVLGLAGGTPMQRRHSAYYRSWCGR